MEEGLNGQNVDFQSSEGWGAKLINPPWGSMDIPWGNTGQILEYFVVCSDGIEDIFVATHGGIMRWLNSRCVLG